MEFDLSSVTEYDRETGQPKAPEPTFDLSTVTDHTPLNRGMVGDIGSHLARGGVQIAKSAGHMLDVMDPDGGIDLVGNAGKHLVDWAEKLPEKVEFLRPDDAEVYGGDGFVKEGVMGGLESAPLSLSPIAAGAASGLAASALIPVPGARIIGGLAGATLATFGLFGLGTYGEKAAEYDKVIPEEKWNADDRHKQALLHAVVEGGLEEVSNVAGMLTFGFGKVAMQPLKQTARELLKTPIKTLGLNIAKNATLNEIPMEMIQGGLGAKIDQVYELGDMEVSDAVAHAVIPAMTMSVLFGLGMHGVNKLQQRQAINQLNSDDVKVRTNSAQIIGREITVKDGELGQSWLTMAQDRIQNNQPIDIEENFVSFAENKLQQESQQQPQAQVEPAAAPRPEAGVMERVAHLATTSSPLASLPTGYDDQASRLAEAGQGQATTARTGEMQATGPGLLLKEKPVAELDTNTTGSPATAAEANPLPEQGLFDRQYKSKKKANLIITGAVQGKVIREGEYEVVAGDGGWDIIRAKGAGLQPSSAKIDDKAALITENGPAKENSSPSELITVKDIRGVTHLVEKEQYESGKVMLRRYKKDGNLVGGKFPLVNAKNLDPTGEKATAAWRDLPYIAGENDKGYKTVKSLKHAIALHGQDHNNYDIKEIDGRFVALKKQDKDAEAPSNKTVTVNDQEVEAKPSVTATDNPPALSPAAVAEGGASEIGELVSGDNFDLFNHGDHQFSGETASENIDNGLAKIEQETSPGPTVADAIEAILASMKRTPAALRKKRLQDYNARLKSRLKGQKELPGGAENNQFLRDHKGARSLQITFDGLMGDDLAMFTFQAGLMAGGTFTVKTNQDGSIDAENFDKKYLGVIESFKDEIILRNSLGEVLTKMERMVFDPELVKEIDEEVENVRSGNSRASESKPDSEIQSSGQRQRRTDRRGDVAQPRPPARDESTHKSNEDGKSHEEVAPSPAPETPPTPALLIEDYSEKAIIVKGNITENKDKIKSIPGTRAIFNKKAGGWVFPKRHEGKVHAGLAEQLAAHSFKDGESAPAKVTFSPEDLPAATIRSAYAHTSNSPAAAAKLEQGWYVDFLTDLRDDLLNDLPDGNEQILNSELTRIKEEYLTKRKSVLSVRSGTVSAHIAGRSNFNSKQAARRGSALDRAEESFTKWQKTAAQEAAVATGVAAIREKRHSDNLLKKQDASEELDRREKAEKKKQNKLKIVNFQSDDNKTITKEEWAKTHRDYKSIVVSDDGTYRYRSIMGVPVFLENQKVVEISDPKQPEKTLPKSEKKASPEVPAKTEESKYEALREKSEVKTDLDFHNDTMDRINDGEASLAEYKAAFQRVLNSDEELTAEISAMTKPQIFKQMGPFFAYRNKSEKKSRVVKSAVESITSQFTLGKSLSYMIGGDFKKSHDDAVRKIVDEFTEQDLKDHAAEIATDLEERKQKLSQDIEAIKDPKTLADFTTYIRVNRQDGQTFEEARMTLNPEQRASLDELAAEQSRKERGTRKEEARSRVNAAGETTDAEIIATKHTKKGYDLFVVKAADRVDRDVFIEWRNAAKKMGGWYSRFRGAGAVPGFQFKEKAAAEAFQKYVSKGDTEGVKDQAKAQRDAYADDRSQTAVERLTEMADKLEEKAASSLGQERKTNTSRRAGMAARAEANAEADKAMAKTMRNIAQSIEAGTAKFLDRIRQKVQVSELASRVGVANYAKLREAYPEYRDYENHRHDAPTIETADFIKFPTYTAYRSDLAKLGRQLQEHDGTKTLGKRLMKVADDVTSAYLKFAKENLPLVSTFTKKDGGVAVFSSKPKAEKSIRVSGFNGKAIVLPFKRGENIIIMSPSEARNLGIWDGDSDKRLSLSFSLGKDIVEKGGKKLDIPWQFQTAHEGIKRLAGMGIETSFELRAAAREYINLRAEPKEADKVKELERAMIGRRNDGMDFFPTPESTADEMVQTAGIEEGMKVLEPSAGWGHIAEKIRDAGVEPEVVEMSNDRKELLEAKGFTVIGRDFMDVEDGGYDRIIMNPPFSDRRDAEHVKHAYELLKPGGRLVAIMGEGVFFGKDKKASAFREWLEDVGGSEEKMEQGTFLDSSLPVNTGVNSRMVVIDKAPGEDVLHSKGKGSGTTKEAVRAEIEPFLTPKGVKNLLAAGTFQIHQGEEEAAVAADLAVNDIWGDKGFFVNDTFHLIADNITEGKALGVYLHEAGVHYGLTKMVGSNKHAEIIKQLKTMNAFGNKKVKAARSRVPKGTAKAMVWEETLGYLVEDPANHKMTVVQKVIAALKAWLFRMGWKTKGLTTNDIVTLIRQSGRVVADEAGSHLAGMPSRSPQPAVAHSTGKDITDTTAFREWFGDSQVVDETGEPLVVYHGTAGAIDEFDPAKVGSVFGVDETGFFFTTNTTHSEIGPKRTYEDSYSAGAYAKNAASYSEGQYAPAIMPVYLSIKNPLTTDDIANNFYLDKNDPFYGDHPQDFLDGNKKEIMAMAKDGGHDGIILDDGKDNVYVAFSPTQIKSIYNQGAFNPTDPHILHSKAQEKEFTEAFADDTLGAFELAKRMWKGRKSGWRKNKGDTSILDRFFNLPTHYFKKVPALGRMQQAALDRNDDYHESLYQVIGSPSSGPHHTEVIEKFRKEQKKEFKAFGDYLFDRDRNNIGYRIKEEQTDDGSESWLLFNQKNKLVSSHATEMLAVEAMIEHEAADFRKGGWSDQAVEALIAARQINNNGFNVLFDSMRQVIKSYKEAGKPLPQVIVKNQDGEEISVNLKQALRQMGDLRGSYMPRVRKPGRFTLRATKKGTNPILEHFDLGVTLEHRRVKLEEQGYTVTKEKAEKLPEDVFQMAGEIVAMQAVINQAINKAEESKNATSLEELGMELKGEWQTKALGRGKKKKNHKVFVITGERLERFRNIFTTYKGYENSTGEFEFWDVDNVGWRKYQDIQKKITRAVLQQEVETSMDTKFLFAKSVAEQVANTIRARGFRAHMNKRVEVTGKDVWLGYEEDPAMALAKYARGISAGEAKKKLALKLTQNFTGTDYTWQEFKSDQLLQGIHKPDYQQYIDIVKDRRIDPINQPNAFRDGKVFMEDMLRNDEAVDRVIGTIKAAAVLKYLGFRVAAPLVNLTALVTSVPATMNGYANIPFHKTMGLMTKAGNGYRDYKKGGGTEEMNRVFAEIEEKGWHKAQFNREALAVLESKLGRGWNNVLEWSMTMFGMTEQLNRVVTIVGTYSGIKDQHKGAWTDADHRLALQKAKEVSDKAHGVYGKANRPHVARGSNPFAQVVRSFYMFKTFSHNYLATMKDLGFDQKQRKAALFMALSPAVIAGAGASILTPVIAQIAKSFGFGGDDPEEQFYTWLEESFGEPVGMTGRYGIAAMGGYGVNLKGSLAISIGDLPTSLGDLVGAPGSVVMDLYEGGRNITKGNILKGAEKMLPLAIGSVLKAGREATEGLTTRTNAPIFYGNKPVVADTVDTIYRVFSFNPPKIAKIREQRWSETKLARVYTERRADIYAKLRRFYLLPAADRSRVKLGDMIADIKEYNDMVLEHGDRSITPITSKNIKAMLRRSFRPPKKERLRAANQ